MRKIRELLGKKKLKGDVGIEIECEGAGMGIVDTEVWKTEDDGSLRPRGGFPELKAEFILREPIPITMVKDALNSLKDELPKAKFAFSSRCSIHVHVNVLELEYQQMLAMIYAYYLLEEPFMTFCGKSRKGNNFCLRLMDAEGQLEQVMSLIKSEDGIRNIVPDMSRYSALNIEALRKYGSIEFRGMEGNMDVERIDNWCNALICLRNYAVEAGDIVAVQKDFQELGGREFIRKVLQGGAEHFLYRNVGRDMDYAHSISFDIPLLWGRVKSAVVSDNYADFDIGAILDIDKATLFMHRGGQVDGLFDGNYKVKKRSTGGIPEIKLF